MTKAQAAFLEKIQSLNFSTGKSQKPKSKTISCDHCGGEWEVHPMGEVKTPLGLMQFGMAKEIRPSHWKN